MKKSYQGGFTNEKVVNAINTYVDDRNGNPYGYVGHEYRTKKYDKILDGYANISNDIAEDVSTWVCSRPARHFMDKLEYDGFEFNDLKIKDLDISKW